MGSGLVCEYYFRDDEIPETEFMTRLFVTFEGIDASGKATQAKRLCDKYTSSDYSSENAPVVLTGFPQYLDNYFGKLVRRYLNGEFGTISDNHPLLTSLLYAMDRWESRAALRRQIHAGVDNQVDGLVICDRYVDSNLAHQGARLQGQARVDLMREIEHIEYEVLGLPKPDAVFFMDIPSTIASARLAIARSDAGTDTCADIYEEDLTYLAAVYETYQQMASGRLNWYAIDCVSIGGALLDEEEIAGQVWPIVERLLQERIR